ncbi:MAG: helix-turn-helix domain-containing protein [Acidimicrobiia bacterium]
MSVSFGDSIRRGREAAGLSQARVAQLIGRSPSTVRAWEQARSNPSDSESVAALAAVLGLDESALLGKAGFEPAFNASRASLESELASLRTIEVPVERDSPRHLGLEGGAVATAPPPSEPWIEVEEKAPFDIKAWIEPRAKAVLAKANELKADFQQRLKDRPRPEPRPKPDRRRVPSQTEVVAAQPMPAPVKLDPRLGPLVAKSYIEDDSERDFYRRRMVGTLLVLVFLFVTLWWALRNTGGAIGEFVGGFIDELQIQ